MLGIGGEGKHLRHGEKGERRERWWGGWGRPQQDKFSLQRKKTGEECGREASAGRGDNKSYGKKQHEMRDKKKKVQKASDREIHPHRKSNNPGEIGRRKVTDSPRTNFREGGVEGLKKTYRRCLIDQMGELGEKTNKDCGDSTTTKRDEQERRRLSRGGNSPPQEKVPEPSEKKEKMGSIPRKKTGVFLW